MDIKKQLQTDSTPLQLPVTLADYAMRSGKADIIDTCRGINTGFANIDRNMTIMPGIYMLGAMPALGKTTFAHQLGEQISETGKPVLYFTFEQRKIDFLLKSLARESAVTNLRDAVSAVNLRFGVAENNIYMVEKYESLCSKYIAKNLSYSVIECEFGMSITALTSSIEQYIQQFTDLPVLFIDYLQVIGVDKTSLSQRDSVDTVVEQIKQLQQKYKLTIFLISSVSRQNYLSALEIDSFKESGKIEYTADIIWGLQYKAVHDNAFANDNNITRKREALAAEKTKTPRSIELVCLKNRFGSTFECSFSYYPEFDYFKAIDK